MKTLNDWLKAKGINESTNNPDNWTQEKDPDLLESQLELMANKIDGLFLNLTKEEKTAVAKKFIATLKERLL